MRSVSPRGSKRHPVSPADARAYLSKASAWLQAAQESAQAGRWDVAAGSAVTAGINACDSLTGVLLGLRAGGEHSEAVDLLSGAGSEGRQAARQLSQLLAFKSPAQYEPTPLSEADATKAVELARRLVERAAQVNSRRPR